MPTTRYELNGLIFEWDDDKADKVQKSHKIQFVEVCTVFFDENELTYEDVRFDYDEQRFITIGLSNRARLLVVGWTLRENIRLITAIKAERKHEQIYQRKR
ncbi:hypothetical protein B0181_07575 [Moraxella caviae]|uniref:Protein of uncharacterized function (DUF497) n=1 Tax=Moraxella caviae TaxID=34060 RepID=A0A1T0A0X0_9GAMM|nr:BrnT family toxin [Moraxella caviae]OOR88851.1 hypothetical protein B0181_07575 [Moraxella caviae]STZ10212.1 Protein of uncharacterised function (DUF497) [Moraxella caviae]VEW12376.1 Protein of uncharacterised function (DUF497) [Moraxella caviae]